MFTGNEGKLYQGMSLQSVCLYNIAKVLKIVQWSHSPLNEL